MCVPWLGSFRRFRAWRLMRGEFRKTFFLADRVDHLAGRFTAMNLKDRLGDIESTASEADISAFGQPIAAVKDQLLRRCIGPAPFGSACERELTRRARTACSACCRDS